MKLIEITELIYMQFLHDQNQYGQIPYEAAERVAKFQHKAAHQEKIIQYTCFFLNWMDICGGPTKFQSIKKKSQIFLSSGVLRKIQYREC